MTFRECADLAFDLQEDPHEQDNLLKEGASPPQEVERLRSSLREGFDYGRVLEDLQKQRRKFLDAYPGQVSPRTSTQILLGDGRLVDADMHLEYPTVVSERPSDDFDDWPE